MMITWWSNDHMTITWPEGYSHDPTSTLQSCSADVQRCTPWLQTQCWGLYTASNLWSSASREEINDQRGGEINIVHTQDNIEHNSKPECYTRTWSIVQGKWIWKSIFCCCKYIGTLQESLHCPNWAREIFTWCSLTLSIPWACRLCSKKMGFTRFGIVRVNSISSST